MWKEYYHAAGIYDFDYTLQRLDMDPLINVNMKERWVDVPVRIDQDNKCVVRVKGEGTTEKPVFSVMSDYDEDQDVVFEHIRNLFQWDRDLQDVEDFFEESDLARLFFTYAGTPIVKDFHLYDSLMKVIIHQQLNMKFAYTLSTRFVQKFGEQVDGSWFYPKPEVVAKLDYQDLRDLQFSQRKAEYVIDTSRLITNGELELESFAKKTNEEVMKALGKVRGVGPWTVQNWLMFGLGREDLFPAADVGIQNALKKEWRMEEKPKKDVIEKAAQKWSPYRSYAALTLWRSIEG
ncbi:DNA-3-methyladenine glycosylase family protein [Alkalibacillus haloalkaliphilus]|uniref:DNA-3-methyladenine glycosylase family protein n=1 Tax=Alkalibacillus haloalkaliphilus TaxID=94136 RepID=UPI00293577CE|nr:DNA-3-methyladenine glycosylase [Alkalibacillus haloalkaliphilus]MDV2581853.1 DNA-3-methyladenine glycosylase [Alkalibacillus haloalkaliphilus]